MPLKSKAQLKYLMANNHKLAVKFVNETSDLNNLPPRVKMKKAKFGKQAGLKGSSIQQKLGGRY